MHIRSDKKTLLARTNRLLGQVEAIRRKIEEGGDEDCFAVLNLMTSARGALDGLIRVFIEGHIREHVVEASNAAKRARAGEELIETLRAFLR